eukprot:223796_1
MLRINVSILLLHSCNIYGTIPSKIQLLDLHTFTLFDNRLSGQLPSSLIENASLLGIPPPIVIPGNLFKTNTYGKFPKWVNSNPWFPTAFNLFITPSNERMSNIPMILSLICFLGHEIAT